MKKTDLLSLGFVFIFLASCNGVVYKQNEARIRASNAVDNYYSLSDIEAEIKFGRDLAARILGNYSIVKDKSLLIYVNRVGTGLTQFSGRPELKFYFGILKTKEINAFAAPGGYVFITEGLLKKMKNESELAGVLGHEIAHIVNRHVIKKIKLESGDTSGFGGLSDMLGGTTAVYRAVLEKAFNEAEKILFKTGYSDKDEIDADKTGILICASAGYDPYGLKNVLTGIKGFEIKKSVNNGVHPFKEKRLEEIASIIDECGLDKLLNSKVTRRFKKNVHFK